jgi:hypothetical protein
MGPKPGWIGLVCLLGVSLAAVFSWSVATRADRERVLVVAMLSDVEMLAVTGAEQAQDACRPRGSSFFGPYCQECQNEVAEGPPYPYKSKQYQKGDYGKMCRISENLGDFCGMDDYLLCGTHDDNPPGSMGCYEFYSESWCGGYLAHTSAWTHYVKTASGDLCEW